MAVPFPALDETLTNMSSWSLWSLFLSFSVSFAFMPFVTSSLISSLFVANRYKIRNLVWTLIQQLHQKWPANYLICNILNSIRYSTLFWWDLFSNTSLMDDSDVEIGWKTNFYPIICILIIFINARNNFYFFLRQRIWLVIIVSYISYHSTNCKSKSCFIFTWTKGKIDSVCIQIVWPVILSLLICHIPCINIGQE